MLPMCCRQINRHYLEEVPVPEVAKHIFPIQSMLNEAMYCNEIQTVVLWKWGLQNSLSSVFNQKCREKKALKTPKLFSFFFSLLDQTCWYTCCSQLSTCLPAAPPEMAECCSCPAFLTVLSVIQYRSSYASWHHVPLPHCLTVCHCMFVQLHHRFVHYTPRINQVFVHLVHSFNSLLCPQWFLHAQLLETGHGNMSIRESSWSEYLF